MVEETSYEEILSELSFVYKITALIDGLAELSQMDGVARVLSRGLAAEIVLIYVRLDKRWRLIGCSGLDEKRRRSAAKWSYPFKDFYGVKVLKRSDMKKLPKALLSYAPKMVAISPLIGEKKEWMGCVIIAKVRESTFTTADKRVLSYATNRLSFAIMRMRVPLHLRRKVEERTDELVRRLEELEEFKDFAVQREKELMRLRKRVAELEAILKEYRGGPVE